jgi:GNAT superfamily N-acetyltransferase
MACVKKQLEFSKGQVSDSEFLAHAILQAERAHTGRGIWDEYYHCKETSTNDSGGDDNVSTANVLSTLKHCVENAADSIYHFERFIVARDSTDCVNSDSNSSATNSASDIDGSSGSSSGSSITTRPPVACACGFRYPDVTMGHVLKGLRTANSHLLQWSSEESERAEARLSFLSNSFPAGVDFAEKWMIEAVFTDPLRRGRGLAAAVLTQVLQLGRDCGCKEAVIVCAVGNTPALQLYAKLGFEPLGCGDSEECMRKLMTPGFNVLRYVYE